MKFFVITPCFNSEKFIKETIESVLYQKGEFEIEYFLIDGLSTDSTLDIINETLSSFRKTTPSCKKIDVTVISEKDSGMYDAVAKGMAKASGDIICYINSDDFYQPDSFSKVHKVMTNPNIKWVTGLITTYNEAGKIVQIRTPYIFKRELIEKGMYGTKLPFIQQESCFWKKNLLKTIDLKKFALLKYAGDFYLWKNFAAHSHLYQIDSVLSGFRIREGQLSQTCRDKYMDEFNVLRKKYSLLDTLYCYTQKVMWHLPNSVKLAFTKSHNLIIENEASCKCANCSKNET